jgi:hypothetical protein
MLQAVRKRWGRIHEHRPRTLSIAVNGHIIAFHDVRAEHSNLSARIEHPEHAQFVEVFSEQDIRFALLTIGELPPGGAPVRTQRVELSDDRWLELSLAFDGQGLHGQVAYFDPALASQAMAEEPEETPEWESNPSVETPPRWFRLRSLAAAFRRTLAARTPAPAFAWALLLAILFGTAAYVGYRHPATPTVAMKILDESVKTEQAALRGQTEHQLLRVEEVANGKVLEQGTVELWKDGDGDRYLRRLFDSQHRMLAAEWRNQTGEHSSRRSPAGKNSGNHPLVMSEFWDQDLSAQAFSTLAGQDFRMHTLKEGYELTTDGPIEGHPQLVSAALVLNRRLLPVRATLRVLAGTNVHELRFVQAGYERRPRASVPDTMFDPALYSGVHDLHPLGIHPPNLPLAEEAVPLLAELQIAVLYQLNRLGADTGAPIEVKRTADGYIQISGAIADDSLKQRIAARLRALPNHQLLSLKLFSPHELRMHASHAPQNPATRVYEINQSKSAADALLRKHFQDQGLAGEKLDSAVVTFSHDALDHAQRALQHAFALDRLGQALSASELRSVSVASQQQWTEMLHQHASELEQQLVALRGQLDGVTASAAALPNADAGSVPIENPQQFSRAASRLLQSVQELNHRVSSLFASGTEGEEQTVRDDTIGSVLRGIPLLQSREIEAFAMELSSSRTPQAIPAGSR